MEVPVLSVTVSLSERGLGALISNEERLAVPGSTSAIGALDEFEAASGKALP
jgi:hypothetical protein